MTEMPWDIVDEAGRESFPASDPPAWDSWHVATPEPTPPKRALPVLPILAGAAFVALALALLAVRRRALS